MFANASGAEIIYLHVAAQGDLNSDYGYDSERAAEQALSRLVSIEPTISGIGFSHDVKVSDMTADTILEYANDYDVGLIVIPTHRDSRLSGMFVGSVSQTVLRNASCAVAIVRPESRFFEEEGISKHSVEAVLKSEMKEGLR